jgi:K+-sensing histidine kinase KdpD
MSFHGAKEFADLKNNLAQLFVSTATQFASNCGLESMDEAALYHQMSTKLEDVASEVLMFGTNTWPDTALDQSPSTALPSSEPLRETYPSETDPPVSLSSALLYTLGTLLVTAPLAFLLSAFVPSHIGTFFYAIGVMSVSMVFGTRCGLILALISPVLHNLFDIPPTFSFTWPQPIEVVSAVCFLSIAVAVPFLMRTAFRIRVALAQPRPASSTRNSAVAV